MRQIRVMTYELRRCEFNKSLLNFCEHRNCNKREQTPSNECKDSQERECERRECKALQWQFKCRNRSIQHKTVQCTLLQGVNFMTTALPLPTQNSELRIMSLLRLSSLHLHTCHFCLVHNSTN